jgi:hypothetical protein
MVQIMRGRGECVTGHETQALPVCKPTRLWKVVQILGRCSLEMPREDTKES